jgi:arylsulfatase A-like enzyme
MIRRRKLWLVWVILGLILAGLGMYFRSDFLARWLPPIDERPSYVLIVLDDLDWDLVASDFGQEPSVAPRFPVLHDLARGGMVFSNFHSTTPVCGPARASILSGQYAHRHQARVNRPNHPTAHGFAGGYSEYGRNRDFSRFFQAGGYQTCFVGKYLHDGFQPDREKGISWPDLLPYGWDRFYACLGATYNDLLVVDSATKLTHKVPDRFRTDYEADQVIAMLAEQEQTRKAQFVCWFSLAPHDSENGQPTYPPQFQADFLNELPPAFERSTGSAGLRLPKSLKDLPPELSAAQRSMLVEKWRERLRSIKSFDENLGRVREYLADQNRLENTVFVITSDHGYRLGDHGHIGKRLPYDRITRVPLLISGAGIAAGHCQQLLGNIDLAPTLIDLALGPQAVPLAELDGRSFAPLLMQPDIDPRLRQELLIECWEAENVWGHRVPGVWAILRGQNYSYTEWATGDREYYDLEHDPEQLENRYETLSGEQIEAFHNRLVGLRQSTKRPPIVTIQSDEWDHQAKTPQNLSYVAQALTGFADAEFGIESIEMEVHDPTAKEYWNGQHWQQEIARLPGRLMNPGGIVSQWKCELLIRSRSNAEQLATPVIADSTERTLEVSVRVTSKNGQVSNTALSHDLQHRPMDPETWIIASEQPQGAEQGLELSGFALGIRPVSKVRVVVQDKDSKAYWNGQGWGETYTQFEAAVEPAESGGIRWRFKFDGNPQQRLYISARALDDKHNFDKTPAFFEWGTNGGDVILFSNNAVKVDSSLSQLVH